MDTFTTITNLPIQGTITAAHYNGLRKWIINSFGVRGLNVTNHPSIPNQAVRAVVNVARLDYTTLGITYPAVAINHTLNPSTTSSGAGGIDTGVVATNTWYYLWMIGQDSANYGVCTTVAGLLSTSSTAPVMPAGYTHKKLLSAVRTYTSGANKYIRYFFHDNEAWMYDQTYSIVSGSGTVARTTLDVSAWMPAKATSFMVRLIGSANATGDGALYAYPTAAPSGGDVSTWIDVDNSDTTRSIYWVPAPNRTFDYKVDKFTDTFTWQYETVGFVFNPNFEV